MMFENDADNYHFGRPRQPEVAHGDLGCLSACVSLGISSLIITT